MKRTSVVVAMVVALTMSMVGGATATHIELPTDSTIDDWTPVDGKPFADSSVDADGILSTEIVQDDARPSGREGIKTPAFPDPVDTISVDLYLDEDWGNGPVAVQFMGQVEGDQRTWPMLEFARIDGFEGFRYFRSWAGGHSAGSLYAWAAQNTLEELGVDYGEWVTLTVSIDRDTNHATYSVNGIPVGGDSYLGPDVTGISHAFLLTENFSKGVASGVTNRYSIGGLEPATYTAQWRGFDGEALFDPEASAARKAIEIDVDYEPRLDVSIDIAGPLSLDVGETGDYEVTVRNNGLGLDDDLDNWNLGLEVERVTSLNEVTLEFCEVTVDQPTHVVTIDDCHDINDTPNVEAKLISGNIIQVVGAGEDTIRPGHFDRYYFRATFHNAGNFTGTVYVLKTD